jgi:hypothetical protein
MAGATRYDDQQMKLFLRLTSRVVWLTSSNAIRDSPQVVEPSTLPHCKLHLVISQQINRFHINGLGPKEAKSESNLQFVNRERPVTASPDQESMSKPWFSVTSGIGPDPMKCDDWGLSRA